jgi:hypothetical protein
LRWAGSAGSVQPLIEIVRDLPDDLALVSVPTVTRLAGDVMFAGAAEWLGARTVAVVLSGALVDGAIDAVVDLAGRELVVDDQRRLRRQATALSDAPIMLRSLSNNRESSRETCI